MHFDFEVFLFSALLLCGLITFVDQFFYAKKRQIIGKKMPVWIEYARSFLPVFLIVFILRSFVFEPFRIPSGSLKPTLLVGDFIVVNKFAYGIRLPMVHKKIIPTGEVKHGDIIVFVDPEDPSMNLIKRIIGLPGDRISYIDKVLYVNGQKAPQEFQENKVVEDDDGTLLNVVLKKEDFLGVKHDIYQVPEKPNDNFTDVVVPEGQYFAMGDNRDESADSRYWGFLKDDSIIGKASLIFISFNSWKQPVRWDRIVKVIR